MILVLRIVPDQPFFFLHTYEYAGFKDKQYVCCLRNFFDEYQPCDSVNQDVLYGLRTCFQAPALQKYRIMSGLENNPLEVCEIFTCANFPQPPTPSNGDELTSSIQTKSIGYGWV